MQLRFHDNKQQHGIVYDYSLLCKDFRKLKTPKEVFDPTNLPLDWGKYFVLLSERASGKTTNLLLLGMIANKHYGTIIQYIRQTKDMTAPSKCGEIFDVILTYNDGEYIKKITDGQWNSIYIHWHKAYYCNKDDNGKVTEQSEKHFLQFLSIDENFNYKSSYNAPLGDFIIYDEFISPNYRLNEFVDFLDMLSTIIRKRKSPIVFMLANTINYNSPYFKELEISKEVKQLKVGEHAKITTPKNTPIYVELIGTKQTTIKQQINQLFFGFNNPKLASITGGDIAWSFEQVPHIVNSDTDKIIDRTLRLDCDDVMLQLDLVETEDRGLVVNVHECTKTHKDSIILTNGEIWNKNQLFGIGKGVKFCDLMFDLYVQNKWYYDSNETGSLVEAYIKTYKQVRK